MIKQLKDSLDTSLKEIRQYQKGEIKQTLTNRPWLDHQGGFIPQSIILICGASFGGKTTELENLKADIMNIEINYDADRYVWLSNSFEMTSLATTLRDLRKNLKKSFKEILSQEFSDEEQEKILNYYNTKTDGRFYINQNPLPSDKFLALLEDFIIQHQDKAKVFIDIDHMALIKSSYKDGKKGSIDDVVEGINELKNKYSNVIFILLTQLNRGILGRIEAKSNDMAIQRGDIYQSDTMFHIADVIYGLQNPYYFKVEEYRLLTPSKYEHLGHRFTLPNKNGKVSLFSEGCIFVEILKDRLADFDFVDLYTIEIRDFDKPQAPSEKQIPVFKDDDCPF